MLSITMNHKGDLILVTEEREIPLNKRLTFTVTNQSNTATEVLDAIDESIHDLIADLVQISCFGTKEYLAHVVLVEVTNTLISKIRFGVTSRLQNKGITQFEIIDI